MIQQVQTDRAPEAIGPYSQAIAAAGLVFCSGQIPIDPGTGELVSGGIGVQTHRVLQNLQAVLSAAGTALERVVKTTVFLTDLGDFAAMNSVYATYFPGIAPGRSTVQVAALPRGAKVEIEAVAVREG